jgi:hypothetical protein
LPDRFSLYLTLLDQIEDVVVRWRSPNASEIGVAFVSQEQSGIEELGQIQDQITLLEEHLQKVGSQLFTLKLTLALH